MNAELLVGSPAQAVELLEEDAEPREGFAFDGLDPLHLVALGSLLDGGAPDDRRSLTRHASGEQGPWVDVVPPAMLASLADLPSLEEEAFEALASRWRAAADCKGWDPEDAVFLLQQIGDLAASARLQDRTLLLRRRL